MYSKDVIAPLGAFSKNRPFDSRGFQSVLPTTRLCMLFEEMVGGVLQQLKFRRERGSAGMTRTGKRKMPKIGGRSSILVRLAVAKPDTHVSGARFPYTGMEQARMRSLLYSFSRVR